MRKVILPVLMLMLVMAIVGCQPTKSETSDVTLWPLITSRSTTTLLEEGWKKTDKGNAVLIVHWNNSQTFDGEGKKTVFTENLGVWPLFDAHSQKTSSSKTDKGNILVLFNYDNTQDLP